MSNLEGALNAAAIQSVLEVIATKNPAATWLISDGQDEKVIYFSTGGIRLYASDHRRIASIEEHLLQRRLVQKEQLLMAQEAIKDGRRESLDEALERMGYLPRPQFLEAISALIHLELCDVVPWENAIFEFYEGNPPPQIFDQKHPALFATLDVKALAGRVREWNHEWNLLKTKVYSERLRLKLQAVAEACEAKAPSPQVRRMYKSIDGQRTLREIAITSGCEFPDVARAARDGLKDRILRGSMLAEKEASSPAEVLDSIEKLEEALDKAINTVLIHKRIATGYEKIQENDRASEHYHVVGNLEAEAGRVDKAVENYRKAMTLSPQNIAVHESLIRRLQDSGDDGKALEEIGTLAKKLFGFGFADRAYESLRGIMSKASHLFDVRILFADVLLSLGRRSEAVKEYLGVAKDKKKIGALEGIEEIYHKVLILDPVNREARSGMSLEQLRRAGKWVLWVHRGSAAAAALILTLWLGNEILARSAWSREEGPVRQLAGTGQYKESMEKIRAVGRSYPASLVGPSLVGIEKGIFKENFLREEGDLERAASLRKDGRLDEARRVFQEVQKMGIVEAQAQRAQQGVREVDSILNTSGDLCKSAEFFINAGSYEDAFVFCRKIMEQFPEAAVARNLRVPFYLRSEPDGAMAIVNGVPWGRTPLWIILSMKGRQDVRVEKRGYIPLALQGFLGRRSPTVSVTLKKE